MVERYRHPIFALQYELSEGNAAHLEDLSWYEERLPITRKPILEIAAGTGRVTRHLSVAGRRLIALDVGRPMLDRLRADPRTGVVPAVCASMRALPFRDGTDLPAAFSAYNSLGCLLERAHLDETFGEVRRVLPPGRPFHFDVAIHRPADWTVPSRTFDWEEWTAPDGTRIRRRTTAAANLERERLELDYDFRWRLPGVDGEATKRVHFALNLWPPDVYVETAERCGFAIRTMDERTYVGESGRERMWAFVSMERR